MLLKPTGYEGPFEQKDPWKFNKERNYAPMAYIWAPFTGDVNAYAEIVRRWCDLAGRKGYIPVAPYLMFPRMTSASGEDAELFVCVNAVNMLLKCQELWIIGGSGMDISNQMIDELIHALRHRKAVRIVTEADLNE